MISNRMDGQELAESVLNFVNGFNPNTYVFIETILCDHPTLQQSVIRLVFELLKAMSAQTYVDARNERAVEMCKRIVSQFGDDMHLPLI